ncbi:SDR family oxidoreductase [Actinomadura terrae]|uniref:SDR family oxidoreductase n=1 Tax=Actinomadura terrae TaxID=604353 RepID=UPI001FA790C2|nr:SDR family NAD(P)-dependent oxidoreductase [Actinomadura terrae]
MRQRKVAVITGGSKGIGARTAVDLAAAGNDVAICYHADDAAAAETAEAVDASGTPSARCITIRCDVADPSQVDTLFERVEQQLGPAQILVCCAGVLRDRLLVEMTDADWHACLSVNLSGVFHCIRRAARPMIQARWGRIIVAGSAGATAAVPGQANYAASKSGLVGLVRAAAAELGTHGATCNLITPGPVDTEIIAHLTERQRARLADSTLLRRFGSPGEVAALITFLASEAASYVTGTTIGVDAGLSART